MTVTDETPPIDFCRDGTVKLLLGDKQVRLARPTIGQLRTLQERLGDANDDIRDHARAFGDPPSADVKDADEYRRLLAEWKEAQRVFLREHDRLRGGWFAQVLDVLASGTAPPEDPPAWAVTGVFATELLNHWQTVPLAVADR